MNWLIGTESERRDQKKLGRFDLHSLFQCAEKDGHVETTGMLVSYCTEEGGNIK